MRCDGYWLHLHAVSWLLGLPGCAQTLSAQHFESGSIAVNNEESGEYTVATIDEGRERRTAALLDVASAMTGVGCIIHEAIIQARCVPSPAPHTGQGPIHCVCAGPMGIWPLHRDFATVYCLSTASCGSTAHSKKGPVCAAQGLVSQARAARRMHVWPLQASLCRVRRRSAGCLPVWQVLACSRGRLATARVTGAAA